MSGVKTIQNNSNVTIAVTVIGRIGQPGHNGPAVSAMIPPHESATLHYGNDQNPYMNSLAVQETSNGSSVSGSFVVTATGGSGTLDNLFNVNSTVVVAYNASNYSFSLSAHN
jgi:hypothetical protein